MDRPKVKKTATAEPERRPEDEIATAFFPDFATVSAALEAGQMGIWSWDVTTNAVTWSRNIESMCGLPPGSFDGTYAFLARDIHDEDRPAVLAAIDETLRTGCPYRVRYRVAPQVYGEDRWIEAAGTLTIEDGAPKRMVGLCHDVTDRINLQQELRSRAKQQEALAKLGERALVETDIELLLNDVVSTVALTLPVDFVKVLELMPGDNELLLRAGFGWKPGDFVLVHVGFAISVVDRDEAARQCQTLRELGELE